MAQTTFSGPILAGTIKNTTGTTVGTDMKNTGQVVMAQTFAIDLFLLPVAYLLSLKSNFIFFFDLVCVDKEFSII